METDQSSHLTGSCSCGRNRYTIQLPAQSRALRAEIPYIYFDNSIASREYCFRRWFETFYKQATHAVPGISHATLLTAYISTSLASYNSTTHAYYPDESHTSIRRAYTDPAGALRHFCGYCGSQLSRWDEQDLSRGESISVSVGTLEDESLDDLLDIVGIGLEDTNANNKHEEQAQDEEEPEDVVMYSPKEERGRAPAVLSSTSRDKGVPWFEELVEDSRLGRLRRQRGGYQKANSNVEWEVIEISDGTGQDSNFQLMDQESIHTKRKFKHLQESS